MSPSRKDKRRRAKRASRDRGTPNGARAVGSKDWAVSMYKTARPQAEVPARSFLVECPSSVRQMLVAILVAVRDAPPPSFPASNMWHAMRGDLKGFHEARDEHDGHLYRLFCVVDREAPNHGLDAPTVAVISGGIKPQGQKMDAAVYQEARAYRADYEATRRILLPPGIPAGLMKRNI